MRMTAGDSNSSHYEGKDLIIKTEARAWLPWHYLINQPFA